MYTSKVKKGLSLLLAIVMMFTMMPTTIFSFAADESYPVMKAYTSLTGDYHDYKDKVVTVTFLDYIDEAAYEACSPLAWDVSASAETGTVKAWMKENVEESNAAAATRYDVYIGGEGGIGANPKSSDLFFNFISLKEVKGLENFKTDNVTTLACFFQNCSSLKSVDLSTFDTSNVTDMSYMFYGCSVIESIDFKYWNTSNVTNMSFMFTNCLSLPELNISCFDTRKVTNMMRMFYRCESLKTLYTGDYWTVEQVTNSSAMFNCCYVIEGKIPFNYNAVNDKSFATTEGYLTYKAPDAKKEYTVTYSFVGDIIPEGVTPPVSAVYDEGTTVVVEADSAAEGYIFSGWSTEDATVENGEFVINNDVHFVGSWEKLYTVRYEYAEGYEIPEGAPTPEMLEMLSSTQRAGDDVDVAGVMYADERHVFVGWYTDDADVSGNMFTMPENDVVLKGYFKIPVESVEFMHDEDVVIDINDESVKLNIWVKPEDATIKTLVFESSDESVAKVDEYGNITPVGEGEAEITVKSADDPTKSDTVKVTVKNPVTDIETDKTNIILNKGDEDKITATVVPENATNKKVIYESGDDSIVTVDENGNLVAVGEGTTTITVKADDNNNIKEIVTVTVKIPVKEITVPEKEIIVELDSEEEVNIGAQVNSDATNKVLIYESENNSVVKVSSDGTIIPTGEGETTVTVKSQDNPDIYETVKVIVIKNYKVTYEYIGAVIPENAPAVPVEKTYKAGSDVNVETAPYVAGYTFSGWSTDDAAVAEGKFVINNDVHFVGSWEKISVDNVTTDKTSVELTEGETDKITVTVTPEGALDPTVTYKSSDETVVKVDEDGNIEAVGEGTATITITSNDDPTVKVEIPVVIKAKMYKVTYEYIGAVIPENAPAVPVEKIYKAGSDVNVETAPYVSGYTFSGWSTDDAAVAEGKFVINNDVHFVGSWEKISVDNVTTDKTSVELTEGETDKITVTVTPEGALDPTVTYKSSDETVVKVDENGNIEAVGEGTATITITSNDDPTIEKKVTVTVKKPVVYYSVTYRYEGEVPANAPAVPVKVTYVAGETVTVAAAPSLEGYTFSGWSTDDAAVSDGKFVLNNDVEFVGKWTLKPGPVTGITAPEKIEIVLGQEVNVGASVNENAINKKLNYISDNEAVAKVDADGNITANKEGTANIYVTSDANPGIYKVIVVTVVAEPEAQGKHYMVFGKTEKIGWYSVSFDGGETFQVVFGNSNHVVDHGSEVIIKANDVFGDPFTFYINGQAVTPDENGYVHVTVDNYVLVGALGIPVIAPDGYEALNWFQQIIQAIKNFFAKIASWFKK